MTTVVMGALGVVGEMLAPYGNEVPFGVSAGEFIGYAQGQFMKRMTRLEKALGQTIGEVDYGSAALDVPRTATAGGDGASA